MSRPPRLLKGATAIAEHLLISPRAAQRLHQQGRLPTFRSGGTPYATVGALDEWRALSLAGKLPIE